MTIRADIAAQLKADWASVDALAPVRVIATEGALDDIRVPTALLRQKSIATFDPSPMSHRNVSLLLTLISKHSDPDLAADELEGVVFAALDYLDPRYLHTEAEAVAYGNRLAYDITLTIASEKD